MSPDEIKKYYGDSCYIFHKKTGMSAASLCNWLRWGYVPFTSQAKLQQLTKGGLKATWERP